MRCGGGAQSLRSPPAWGGSDSAADICCSRIRLRRQRSQTVRCFAAGRSPQSEQSRVVTVAVAVAATLKLDVDQTLELAVDGLAHELLELGTVRCDELSDSLIDCACVHIASVRPARRRVSAASSMHPFGSAGGESGEVTFVRKQEALVQTNDKRVNLVKKFITIAAAAAALALPVAASAMDYGTQPGYANASACGSAHGAFGALGEKGSRHDLGQGDTTTPGSDKLGADGPATGAANSVACH